MIDLAREQLTLDEQTEIGRACRECTDSMVQRINYQLSNGWPGIHSDGEMALWLLNTAREALKGKMS